MPLYAIKPEDIGALPPRILENWFRAVGRRPQDVVELPLLRVRRRYATPRAATEFRFVLQAASHPAVVAALRRLLEISYADNPEYFQLAAAVDRRARDLGPTQ